MSTTDDSVPSSSLRRQKYAFHILEGQEKKIPAVAEVCEKKFRKNHDRSCLLTGSDFPDKGG
jgi:hypothetical protein